MIVDFSLDLCASDVANLDGNRAHRYAAYGWAFIRVECLFVCVCVLICVALGLCSRNMFDVSSTLLVR